MKKEPIEVFYEILFGILVLGMVAVSFLWAYKVYCDYVYSVLRSQ